MIKRIAFSCLLLCLLFSAKAQVASADAIMKDAYQLAAKEKKNVFVMFHASWCVWCHKMDTSMNDPACKKFFNDNYIIRHLVVDESKANKDLENPGADEFRKKYYGDGHGIPFWLVFDKDGKLLADSKIRGEGDGPEKGQNTGCPATEEEVTYFIEVLKKTSRITSSQLAIIKQRFRKNDQ